MITPTELLRAARDIFARNANVERSTSAYAASAVCRSVPITDPDAVCFCGRGALLNAGYDAGLRNEGSTTVLTDSSNASTAYLIAREALDAVTLAEYGMGTIGASDSGRLAPRHFDAAIARLTMAGVA